MSEEMAKQVAALIRGRGVAIFSGALDPVGGAGKLVEKLYKQYVDLGVKDVSIKLYADARHEILNEICRDEVFADFLATIDKMTAKA